jgi:diguanylate cyclase (GGDEF)-like protein
VIGFLSELSADRSARLAGPADAAVGQIVLAPIWSGGAVIGRIATTSRRAGGFTAGDESALQSLARELMADVEAARLHRLATVDPATRTGSRLLLWERLGEEVARSHRQTGRPPLAILRAELAAWEQSVKSYGSERTTAALCELSRRLLASVRATDTVARLQEDALCCILPLAGQAGAQAVAERLSGSVAALPIELGRGEPARLRLAIAVWAPALDAEALLAATELTGAEA